MDIESTPRGSSADKIPGHKLIRIFDAEGNVKFDAGIAWADTEPGTLFNVSEHGRVTTLGTVTAIAGKTFEEWRQAGDVPPASLSETKASDLIYKVECEYTKVVMATETTPREEIKSHPIFWVGSRT